MARIFTWLFTLVPSNGSVSDSAWIRIYFSKQGSYRFIQSLDTASVLSSFVGKNRDSHAMFRNLLEHVFLAINFLCILDLKFVLNIMYLTFCKKCIPFHVLEPKIFNDQSTTPDCHSKL